MAWLVTFAATVVAVLVVVLVLNRRAETGTWSAPTLNDLQTLRKRSAQAARAVADEVLDRKPEVSRTIYLVKSGVELTAGIDGIDDAAEGVSSVVASGKLKRVKVPKWSGSKRGWTKVVACTRDQFSAYNVEVTEQRPAHENFIMAVIGGRAKDIGVSGNHFGGLAPFSGEPIQRAVVFAFSRTLRNRTQTVCETISMEIAHAYGLDHSYHCPDVMTYRRGCGKKRFRDKDAPCGEKTKRACKGGAPTQNSHRMLLSVLGARVEPAAALQPSQD